MPEWESGASGGGAESLCGLQLFVEGIADIESRHSFDYAGFLDVREFKGKGRMRPCFNFGTRL